MGSRKKEEQLRVRTLLSDTVTLLCKNGLSFKKNLKVQGLLGITVDDDEVFIVHLNETMGDLVSASDPDQTEARTPSKNSESGRRSPKRKRRRRSTDSNKSKEQEEECIDLDPDIEIKTEPDMLVVDEVKYEGTPSKQSCRYPDEGLNFAIGSISSQNERFAPGSRGITPQGRQAADSLNTTSDSDANLSSASPFITGIIPNVADTSNQSSESGSFQWDNSAGQQGFPGISNWGSQIAQQAMSQSDMSQQPGTSQGGPMGYSPSIRTGTNKPYMCGICGKEYVFKKDVTSHIENKHRNQKKQCEKCLKLFSAGNSLYNHRKACVMGVKYPCKYCDYASNYKNNTTLHMKRRHANQE